MLKTELLENLQNKRDKLNKVVNQIKEQGSENEIIEKKWYLKDVIAHISYYENEVVKVLPAKSMEGKVFWKKADDERNKEIYAETTNFSLLEITDRANQIFNDLFQETTNLSQNELDNPFPGMKRHIDDFIAGLT